MEFRILGPVEVEGKGGLARLGGTKQLALLASLIVQANRVVPHERLIAARWGEVEPPATPNATLHSCFFQLRKALAEVEPDGGERIVTHPTGYLLRTLPGEVDLEEFQTRVKRGQEAAIEGELADAVRELQGALRLWRGPALDGAPGRFAQSHATRLNETRIAITEELIDIRLTLGEHAALIPELNALVVDNPLRERLRGQQMLAMYRGDRQADALAAYQEIYRLLADEVGIQPGPALQQLHRRMLAADPALDVPRPQQRPQAPVTAIVPRQLPSGAVNFTGRRGYLDELDALLNSEASQRGSTVVISGAAGVGKTALALHWAHRVASQLADGQLYVNLRGYAPNPPMTPAEVLAQFLRALDVPQEKIPAGQDEQAALYRSLLAGRRMLVVLDNASTAEQVRPLLPGSPTCFVLVTSRDDLWGLTALDGARRLVLDVLAPEESRILLSRTIGGGRVRMEEEAGDELARMCDHLPLALRIAAAQLASDPHRTIAGYRAELTEQNKLRQLEIHQDPEAAVRASFGLSYQRLTPESSRMFRLLGLVPGHNITAPAAAALAAVPVDDAAKLLDQLAAAHLVERATPGRFQFHDLIRLYAKERAEAEDEHGARDDALHRLFDWYLGSVDAAVRRIYPVGTRLPREPVDPVVRPVGFTQHAQALAWLEAERANLIAAQRHCTEHGPVSAVWHLADALRGYFFLRLYKKDWLDTATAGLRFALRAADERGEAAMLYSLAHVHFALGEYPDAFDFGTKAVAAARRIAAPEAEASALTMAGLACWCLGRLDQARDHLTRSLALTRRLANRPTEAITLDILGIVYWEMGRFTDSIEHVSQALEIDQEIGNRYGMAISYAHRAAVYVDLGRYAESLAHAATASALYREIGDRIGEADAFNTAAMAHRDSGRFDQAVADAEQALVFSREIGDRKTEINALNTLGSVCYRRRRFADAEAKSAEALRLAHEVAFRRAEVEALIGLAAARRQLGRHAEAMDSVLSALEHAAGAGFRRCEGQARTVLAEIQLDTGERQQAATNARQALALHREIGHRLGAARALCVFGTAVQQTDGVGAAIPYWREALGIFTELGSPEADQIRAVLRDSVA